MDKEKERRIVLIGWRPKISDMENEFMKRGYLLPEGCKDLADATKVSSQGFTKAQVSIVSISHPLPPAKGIILFYRPMTIFELATTLGQEIFLIIGELVNMGVFKPKKYEETSIETFFAAMASDVPPLDFKTVSVIARKYGFVAQNAAE